MRLLASLLLVLAAPHARAVAPVFDAGFFYFNDAFAYGGSTSTYNRMFWDIMVGMPLSKKGKWVLGWNYDAFSFSDNPGTATTLTITDMGPKLLYYMDKDRTWVIGLTYNLITRATYSDGSANTQMRGTSLRAEFGYVPHMTENLLMGAKLVYYKPSLSEEITNQTQLAQTTNGRTVIYPSFAITYRFE